LEREKTMTDSTIVRRKDEIVTANMEGETVMMSVETGKYYNLGAIGGEIWEMLGTEKSFSQIIDELVDRYDVERAQCAKDTTAFLEHLRSQGLITVQEGEGKA
jgi:hypothetical protein